MSHASGSPLPAVDEIGAEIMARAEALAAFNQGTEGVTRMFATSEHRAASNLILGWMREAGMEAWVDAAGNTVGRYEGDREGLPALMMGSHQDTVRNGGKYDGMLGIITPISCVKDLHLRGERLPFAIEIVAFGDEEGLRFQTSFIGSCVVAGTFDMATLDRRDANGIELRQAMRDFDLDVDAIQGAARAPGEVLAFVEIHIEQGPVLEAEGLPVGIVTAIAGANRMTLHFDGMAGHAGTVPMDRRQDALAAAAEAILVIERRCSGTEALVGTVGMITADPGAGNVIPGHVQISIDIRAAETETRTAVVSDIGREIDALCERRGVQLRIENAYESEGCACTPWVMEQLEAAVAAEGIVPRRLFSGAGHDAMVMLNLVDIGMLFVRCKDGLSHHPDESITAEDAGVGARTLLRFIRAFERPA